MSGVIGKRSDLKRHTHRSPTCMRGSSYRVDRVMHVYGEIQKSIRRQDSHKFFNDPQRRLRVIDDVVAEDDIKGSIAKRQSLTKRSYSCDTSLPGGKQPRIVNGQRIDANSMMHTKIKDQSVRSAADFNNTRLTLDWFE